MALLGSALLPRLEPLLALTRCAASITAGARRSAHAPRSSCSPRAAPPCPPCVAPPAPACRGAAPGRVRAVRVTCCPPPRAHRPPCRPPCAPPPLTCAHALQVKPSTSASVPAPSGEPCALDRDRVAQRLAAAERARRQQYERDARPAPGAATPDPPPAYSLGGELECACATDGREYRVLSVSPPPCTPCTPDRTPPPPCPVTLAPDTQCRVRDSAHMDPCAHTPRVLLDIARGPHSSSERSSHPSGTSATPCQAAAPGGFTKRIMKTLNFNRGSESLSCSKRPCGSDCKGGNTRPAGDPGWCNEPPLVASPPEPCSTPTREQRLRARPGRRAPCQPRQSSRSLHTSTTSAAAADSTPSAPGLKVVLQERDSLREAGRGRIAPAAGGGVTSRAGVAGLLDVRVPAGAGGVRVRVTLDDGQDAPPAPLSLAQGAPAARASFLSENKENSWLSIKGIQRKLSECRSVKSERPDGSLASPVHPGRPVDCNKPQQKTNACSGNTPPCTLTPTKARPTPAPACTPSPTKPPSASAPACTPDPKRPPDTGRPPRNNNKPKGRASCSSVLLPIIMNSS